MKSPASRKLSLNHGPILAIVNYVFTNFLPKSYHLNCQLSFRVVCKFKKFKRDDEDFHNLQSLVQI